jgi:hypothetical protein
MSENNEKDNESHGKEVTIFVNTTPHKWRKDEITYEEVVKLEIPEYPQNPPITYSVKYKKGHGNKPDGTLSKGMSVKVKDGIEFTVSETGQS